MSGIFVSYAKEDRDRVQTLVHVLETQGWHVFWDRVIPVGKTWRDVIGKELTESGCVVAVWSQTSVDSHWVLEEAEIGRQRGILVPVLIDAVLPPLGFQSLQAADLSAWKGAVDDAAFADVLNAITGLIGPSGEDSEEAAGDTQKVAPEERSKPIQDVREVSPAAFEEQPLPTPSKARKPLSKPLLIIVSAGVLVVLYVVLASQYDLFPFASTADPDKTVSPTVHQTSTSDLIDTVLSEVDSDEQPNIASTDIPDETLGSTFQPTSPPWPDPDFAVVTEEGIKLTNPFEMDLVRVPAGEFLMGSDRNRDPDAEDDELPQHPVQLPEFYIGRSEVTNAQYAEFVKAKGYTIPSHWEDGNVPSSKENHPVVYVSWEDAVAFSEWLSSKTGMTFILPTEAQWEKACRGTEGEIFPWGNSGVAGNLLNFADANTNWSWSGDSINDGYAGTAPVGSYPEGASPYGTLDMAGNVWEWTSSLWGEDSGSPGFGYPYDPNDGRENQDAPYSVYRVLRGGSFYYLPRGVRCVYRFRSAPLNADGDYGFRVGLLPPSSDH